MARMRQVKNQIKAQLQSDQWREHLPAITEGGIAHVGPLFAMLLLGPLMMHRAAYALGGLCSKLVADAPEQGRNIIRRFMWHMNEESGNIGWGIPESFAECLAQNALLAREYYRILISYIMDTKQEDNFCDNDILRRSCFWAVGRLAREQPELCAGARPWLIKGLEDQDVPCRGMSAWALAQLPPNLMDAPVLRRLAESGHSELCSLFDGDNVYEMAVSDLAKAALSR